MQLLKAFGAAGLLLLCSGAAVVAADAAPTVDTCATREDVLGLSRIVEIDTSAGPLFGRGENDFLANGEIVLTFDDGPSRSHTRAVLKALAAHCTKATFFMVGKMAASDPAMVREVANAGHTVGSHTWSHAKLSSLSAAKAEEEVELGLSVVSAALGEPAAPFFRFPYLRPNKGAADYLKGRNVASFMIDVDSRDFRTRDGEAVKKNVLTQLAGQRKGILLFHDIQPSTANALADLLGELKERGFKVVHLVAKEPAHTLPAYDTRAEQLLAQKMTAARASLSTRAVTWQQSQSDAPEVLPWAAAKSVTPASQDSTASTSNKEASVPWYENWLAP